MLQMPLITRTGWYLVCSITRWRSLPQGWAHLCWRGDWASSIASKTLCGHSVHTYGVVYRPEGGEHQADPMCQACLDQLEQSVVTATENRLERLAQADPKVRG